MTGHDTAGGRFGPVVTADRVRVAEEAVRIAPPAAPGPPRGEARVQLVREDGVVKAIDVTCGCGERIRVVCEYS